MKEWLVLVDNLLVDFVGFQHDDIPDYNWWSLHSDGYTPEEAFEEWRKDLNYGFPSIY